MTQSSGQSEEGGFELTVEEIGLGYGANEMSEMNTIFWQQV